MFDPEFFPTPPAVVHRMLASVENKAARYFLDPSAGRGDIADHICERDGRYGRHRADTVDCIEQSPDLCAILTDKGYPIVGFDWLTYDGVCYYDAIIMNPPFSNGDAHLLRAWDFMRDGEIVCLLNAETVRNPHTVNRRRLKTLIEQHGRVEELGACFKAADRPTDAEVVLVHFKKTSEDDSAEVWSIKTDEKDHGGEGAPENLLALPDTLGNMQHYYEMANHHMIEAFRHIRRAGAYMKGNDISLSSYKDVVVEAVSNFNHARADFAKKHRKDCWTEVFSKTQFHKWLDKMQSDELIRDINRNSNIPFTAPNIRGTLENVFTSRKALFEKSCANVFDELRRYHPANIHHTEGWKSNSSYKVNHKIVFPYGCRFDDRFMHCFETYSTHSIDIYADLDRIMSVLDGEDFSRCYTIGAALQGAFRHLGHSVKAPFNNETSSQYFDIRFYKKGTVHLTFRRDDLRQAFNVTAAAGRAEIGKDYPRGEG